MFRLTKYEASAACVNCEKDGKPCVHVECDAGTFEGPICQTCLWAECKKRARKPNGPPANGQPAKPANQEPAKPAAPPPAAVAVKP